MPQVDNRFANRIVVVTGAASGIGASTALLFADEGATVYCADIDKTGCLRTSGQIHGTAGREFALPLDVAVEEQWETGFRRVVEASEQVDVLVNSAGSPSAPP